MILSLLNILFVLADKSNDKTKSASSTSINTKTSTSKAASSTSSAISSTSSAKKEESSKPSTLDSKTLCVECYNKEVKTPDCTECECKCDCAKGAEKKTKSFKRNETESRPCPNVDPSEVPCACKDENNRIMTEKSYKARNTNEAALLGVGN